MRYLRPFVALAIACACAAIPTRQPAEAAPLPALDAFAATWATIDDYTCRIVTHEVEGNRVQDRVYGYAFKKPHLAKIRIESGPGRGGGAVWRGGDTVSGHQGG
ncbi:MAG: hypothetical protein KGM44_07415, partial [bacterium]|nr:hypothetical protein [bacterium]